MLLFFMLCYCFFVKKKLAVIFYSSAINITVAMTFMSIIEHVKWDENSKQLEQVSTIFTQIVAIAILTLHWIQH